MSEPTPWPAMLSAAARLGLRPIDFWRLSLREWRALSAPTRGGALTRAAFEALGAAYPDKAI